MRSNMGEPHSDCEKSFVYLGPPDLRYQILMMAAVKAGYMVGILSRDSQYLVVTSIGISYISTEQR